MHNICIKCCIELKPECPRLKCHVESAIKREIINLRGAGLGRGIDEAIME